MPSPALPVACDLLLFDLDGTLVDTLLDIAASINYTMEGFGLPMRTVGEVRRFIGDGTRTMLKRSLGADHEDLVDRAMAIYVPYYHEHLADQSRPFPGVVETLEHFRGKKKVVCTNKGHGPTERMLRDLKLIQYFEAYYGDGAGLPLKPDPGGLLAICERFGVTPARAAMIGDAETDIRAAQAAGAAAFVASYGYRDRDALERLNPTAVFDSFADLRRLIV